MTRRMLPSLVLLLVAAAGLRIALAQDESGAPPAPTADPIAEMETRARAATGDARAAAFGELALALEGASRWTEAAAAWHEVSSVRKTADAAAGEGRCLLAFAEEVLAAGEPGSSVRGAFEDAKTALQRALSLGARDVALRIGIARCLAADGRVDDQIAELRAASAETPDDPAPRRALAFALYHAGRDGEAIPVLRALSDASPADLSLSLTLAATARRAMDEALALAMADRAIDTHPDDRRGWEAVWSIHAPQTRWRELAGLLEERAKRYESNPLGWHYGGFAYASAQMWPEALRTLDRAFALDPKNTTARLEQVRILLTHVRDREKASAYAREILAIEPSNRKAAALLSYVAQRRSEDGDHAGSLREHEVICAATPDDPVALSNLAVELKFSGDYDAAEKAYRRALDVAPGDPQVLNDLGLALMGAGRLDDARARLLEGLASDPASLDCLENLGWLSRHQGRTQESSGWYANARDVARARGSADSRFDRTLDDLAFPLPPAGTGR